MSYLELLLLLHIGSAIIGFGPTFSFALLGPMAAKTGGPQALGILKGMHKIETNMVRPAIGVQLITGILLITEAGWDQDFFSHTWLWLAIVLFVITAALALTRQIPTGAKMIELAESGKAETPEFEALGKRSATLGPILTGMLLVIIILMVLKPGS
jgi:uncharacterized membrane protein